MTDHDSGTPTGFLGPLATALDETLPVLRDSDNPEAEK